MDNAWDWGSRAAREGYFTLYDRVAAEHPDRKYQLDYVPLRLAVMTLWVRHELSRHPDLKTWNADYELNQPLLLFNEAMELAAALAVFALGRMWILRQQGRVARRSKRLLYLRPEWIAMIGFALAWLNPASVISGHGRPTWDVWVAPFYLWAIFLACADWWFAAGALIAIGALLKGQQLIVSLPIFILWPLIGLKFGAAGRWLTGALLTAGLIVSPWIFPISLGPIALLSIAVLFWPVARFIWNRLPQVEPIPARWLGWPIVSTLAIGIWIVGPCFGGNFSWYEIGYKYGAQKFPELENGGASSLASLMQNRFNWRSEMLVLQLPIGNGRLTVSELLICIFAVLLVLSIVAMRLAERKNNRVFLVAMAAPWIVYFAVCPQMHERYLLYGAIAACTAPAVGLGPTLLAIFFGLCSANMSLFQLLNDLNSPSFLTQFSPTLGQTLHSVTSATYPDLAWAILLATSVWLYLAFIPKRPRAATGKPRRTREPENTGLIMDSPPT
ncbi:MAG: hypothetical protein ACJ8JD_03120, partial [Chthoniobacterales bacterium]